MHILTPFRIVAAMILALTLMACGGGGNSSDSSGGGSGGGSNVNWPGNLIGERIEFTVVNPGTSGINAGFTIVYDYDDGGSVRGENPVTGGIYTPDDYSYTVNGNRAMIRLNYSYPNGGAGYEEYELTPSGNNILQGTYNYQAVVTSGTSSGGTASGTYRILAPAAVAIAIEGADELSADESSILNTLLREEDMNRFVADRWGYVALKNNGSIATYSPDATVRGHFCGGNVACTQANRLLSPPSGNHFIDISLYMRAGLALSSDGSYVSWGGESNSTLRTVGFSGDEPVNVQSLVPGSFGGSLIITDEGILRRVYCNHPYAGQNCSQISQPVYDENTRAFPSVSNPLAAYAYGFHYLYYIDQAWNVQLAQTEQATAVHTLPTGLPPMKSLLLISDLVIGLSQENSLVIWTFAGDYLSVPSVAQSDVVSVAATIRYDNGAPYVAIVKRDGSARIWGYTGSEKTMGAVQQPSGIRQAVKVQDAFQRFVFLSGSDEPEGATTIRAPSNPPR